MPEKGKSHPHRLQMKDHLKRKEQDGAEMTLRPLLVRFQHPSSPVLAALSDNEEEPDDSSIGLNQNVSSTNVSTASSSASSIEVLSYRLIKVEKGEKVETTFDVTADEVEMADDVAVVPVDPAVNQVVADPIAQAVVVVPGEVVAVQVVADPIAQAVAVVPAVVQVVMAVAQAVADPADPAVDPAVVQVAPIAVAQAVDPAVDEQQAPNDVVAVVDDVRDVVRVAKEKRMADIIRILNSGEMRSLQRLQLVGAKTADKIIIHCREEGPFRSILDLKKMSSPPNFFKRFCRENKIEM